MLDFEGNISKPSLRSKDRVVFDSMNEDASSELSHDVDSDNAKYWEENTYSNVFAAFSVTPSSNQRLSPSSNVAF